MKRRNVFFVMIMLLIMCLTGCGNSEKMIYNSKSELQNYIEDNKLEEQYAQFDFSIEELEIDGKQDYYIKAYSYEYHLDIAEDLVEQSRKKGIDVAVEMGSLYTCWVFHSYDNNGKANWAIASADINNCEKFEDVGDVDKDELQKYLNENQNNLLGENGTLMLMVEAYDYIKETGADERINFEHAREFEEYYEKIMELRIYEAGTQIWYAPIDYIENDDTMTFIYENGKTLIINLSDWTTSVGNVNNSITDEITDINNNAEYYLNSQGILVDKVEEFETQTFGEYVVKYPILNDGVDEVVVYEFDTYDNIHVVLDTSNVYQQTSLDEMGDYGDVQLEQVAPGRDIAYMFDGERYYIEDYTINLLTISKPINDN